MTKKKKIKSKIKPRIVESEPITLSKVIHKNIQATTVHKRKLSMYSWMRKKLTNLMEKILWQK
jgi:hypothetical protein